jgi:POT family proton-dependent oligopeptide transporter
MALCRQPCPKVVPGPPYVVNICLTELFERFAFYGTRGLLVLYINEGLGYSEELSVSSYSYFMAVCYFVPLFGGYAADALLGRFRAITLFCTAYIFGLGLLVASASISSPSGSIIGLLFMAIGTGGIKPSIATFGAEQLQPATPTENTSYFFIFYFCASAGTMLSYVCAPAIRESSGFTAAFALSLAAMTVATIAFLHARTRYFRHALAERSAYMIFYSVWRASRPESTPSSNRSLHARFEEESSEKVVLIAPQIGGAATKGGSSRDPQHTPTSIPYSLACLRRAQGRASADDIHASASVFNMLPLFTMLPVYWAIFDSQGSIWTLQRKHMDNCMLSASVCLSPAQLGALSPVLVMCFVPLFERIIFPCCKTRMSDAFQPTPLRRMACGMQAACLAFLCTWMVQQRIDESDEATVSAWLQLPQFIFLAISELLVSATGLEWAFSQAPASMRGTVVSLYLAMVAFGNLLTGVLFDTLVEVLSVPQVILLLAGLMSSSGCIFAVLALRYQQLPPLRNDKLDAEESASASGYVPHQARDEASHGSIPSRRTDDDPASPFDPLPN